MDEYYMKIALSEAKKAYKKGEVPIGTVIVKNNKIIAKAHNKREKAKKTTSHAEMLAIQKANKKAKNWRLEGCILYTTLEPCMMCCGAIEQSRIKKIVYGLKNKNSGCTKLLKNIEIEPNILEYQCKEIIQSFFKNKR